jgi:hypothetical protein
MLTSTLLTVLAYLAIHTDQVYCLPIEELAADAGQNDPFEVRTLDNACKSH